MKQDKKFKLELEPIDYQLSVHIQNLMNHYGEAKVKQFIRDHLGFKNQAIKKKVGYLYD